MGSIPDLDMSVDMTPVDYVSQAIVSLSLNSSQTSPFHLCNPAPVHWRWLCQHLQILGYTLDYLNYSEWKEQLLAKVFHAPEHPLYPLLPILLKEAELEDVIKQTRLLQFDAQNTQQGLKDTLIKCPPINEELLRTYLVYLFKHRYIPLPTYIHQEEF